MRAWRGLSRFEGRSSHRTWLYTIATNVCLRTVERRKQRVLPLGTLPPAELGEPPGRPLSESVWLQPCPDELLDLDVETAPEARFDRRESVELAFVAALQHLPPLQRAVLILRDVLGFSAREASSALETTEAAANSALQRARRTLDERRPAHSQQSVLRALGDDGVTAIVQRYAQAMEDADVDRVVAMLVEDAAWAMPPLATWYRGLTAIRRFLEEYPLTLRWQHRPTQVNGQPAVLCYRLRPETGMFEAEALDVLTLDGDRIAEVTAFLDPAVHATLGLPLQLR